MNRILRIDFTKITSLSELNRIIGEIKAEINEYIDGCYPNEFYPYADSQFEIEVINFDGRLDNLEVTDETDPEVAKEMAELRQEIINLGGYKEAVSETIIDSVVNENYAKYISKELNVAIDSELVERILDAVNHYMNSEKVCRGLDVEYLVDLVKLK